MPNDFLSASQGDEPVLEAVLAIVAGSILVSRLLYLVSTKGIKKLIKKARGHLLHILVDMLEEPLALGLVILGFFYAQRRLHFGEAVDATFGKVIAFVAILDLTWAVARLLDSLVQEYLVPRVASSESKLDDQLLPIVRKVSGILIWIVGGVLAISDAGYNVGAIVAGLGIGGLAFAFAAQETIANLFGGVTIFVDAPFRMGDRIKVNGFDGWVREIGLRTSKLETLDGRRLTIPNSAFSKSVIENVSSEPATKVVETIGLALATEAAKVEEALAILRAIIEADPELEANSMAFFSDIAESALSLSLVLWITKGADLALVRSRVNLAVLRGFSKAGIELALPTRLNLSPGKGN